MPFVNKIGAFKLLREIENGKCQGDCRSIWLRNIKYALKTKTNPLNLTATEKQLHRPERKMRQNAVIIYIFYNYVSSNLLNVPL